MSDSQPDLTHLLRQIRDGDERAKDRFVTQVYEELRRLARIAMSKERQDHTLQPTAVVNEALIHLLGGGANVDWESRKHFFSVASRMMRRILIDHARQVGAQKRSGGQRVDLDAQEFFLLADRAVEYLDLDLALVRLEAFSPRLSELVELKFFGGLTFEEIAKVQCLSSRQVKRDWEKARVWLHATMSETR